MQCHGTMKKRSASKDTLLALARGIGRFEGRSSFRTWLHRLAANRARSTYQRLRRRFETQAQAHVVSHPAPARPVTPATNNPDRQATDAKAWPAE